MAVVAVGELVVAAGIGLGKPKMLQAGLSSPV